MNNFNESFAQLVGLCEASTTFMLAKTFGAGPRSIDALMAFDEISDYSIDIMSDDSERERVVAKLLGRALEAASNDGVAQ